MLSFSPVRPIPDPSEADVNHHWVRDGRLLGHEYAGGWLEESITRLMNQGRFPFERAVLSSASGPFPSLIMRGQRSR